MEPLSSLLSGGIKMSRAQRAAHTYVIGQPGMGKTSALKSWVLQDAADGQGLAVLDPHDQLYDDLVFHLAAMATRRPELVEKVVLMDPKHKVWTVGFNPLQPIPGIPRERQASLLTDVIVKIWKLDATALPRTLRLLTHSFVILSEFGLTLLDLPRFLSGRAWRESLLQRSAHPAVAEYFHYEFPVRDGAALQWVTPVLNKIGPLIFDPDMRLMLGTRSTINFRRILDDNLILLVNMPKGILGEGNSALLGAFIVAHLQQAALSRADSRNRNLFFLYLDEFQNYTTDNIKDILSEMRKYGLSLVLAHQFLDQLPTDIRGAVLNTAGTLISFRVGYDDARVLAREIFPPGCLKTTEQKLAFRRVGGYPLPLLREKTEPLAAEALATLLTELRPREFWSRRRGPHPPIKQRALYMPEPVLSEALFQARTRLVNTSGQRYGRLKSEVVKELKHEQVQERPDHAGDAGFYEEV
jgi:hypothetical protein